MQCPACNNPITQIEAGGVTVDICKGGCGGIWLDTGELAQIRSLFNTEEERIEAAQEYFADVFDSNLLEVHQESDERVKKARRFANIFKFITPSYLHSRQTEVGRILEKIFLENKKADFRLKVGFSIIWLR